MKERPILFSSAMVRAILDGSKTMTRRVINPQPTFVSGGWHWAHKSYDNGDGAHYFHTDEECAKRLLLKAGIAPKAGEKRWVKETWQPHPEVNIKGPGGVIYRADRGGDLQYPEGKWKPSIFMPRWASRITLEITGVRVERLAEISSDDALAEGTCITGDPLVTFSNLWDSLNAKRGFPFASSPWVWVLKFRVVRS